MLFEELLQHHWEATPGLSACVSPEHVITGPGSVREMPFINIVVREVNVLFPTNRFPSPQRIAFRLELNHRSFDRAAELAEEITKQLERTTLSFPDGTRAILRFVHAENRCEAENHWVLVREFHAVRA